MGRVLVGTINYRDNIELPVLVGLNGKTPYVGENNNWWIGNVDTGVNAGGLGVEYTTFEVDPLTGILSQNVDPNLSETAFSIENGNLVVEM